MPNEIINKIFKLATAGFGMVIALAWNDAIQSLFVEIFGKQEAVWAKFGYAIFITILVVSITMRLNQILKQQEDNGA